MRIYSVSAFIWPRTNGSELKPAFNETGGQQLRRRSSPPCLRQFLPQTYPIWGPELVIEEKHTHSSADLKGEVSLSSHLTLKFRYYRTDFFTSWLKFKKMEKWEKSVKKIYKLNMQQCMEMSGIIKTRSIQTYLSSTKSIAENAKWRLQILSYLILETYTSNASLKRGTPRCFPCKLWLCTSKTCLMQISETTMSIWNPFKALR